MALSLEDDKILKQTDFPEGSVEHDEGCFVFEIYAMVCRALVEMGKTPKYFSKEEISTIFGECHKRGYIQRDYNDRSYGMYVMNPEKLANEYLSFMLFPYVRCSYTGADFMKFRDEKSWGNPGGDGEIILQVKTLNGNGHFRGLEHDPYDPSPGIARIKSARYFRFKEVEG